MHHNSVLPTCYLVQQTTANWGYKGDWRFQWSKTRLHADLPMEMVAGRYETVEREANSARMGCHSKAFVCFLARMFFKNCKITKLR